MALRIFVRTIWGTDNFNDDDDNDDYYECGGGYYNDYFHLYFIEHVKCDGDHQWMVLECY